jgi:diaminopimelate decarboxylase
MNDDENELTIRDSKRREQFRQDNPDLIVSIMAIGDGETPNANHMVYPKEVVEKAIKDLQDRVKEKTLLVFDNMDGESGRNDLMRAGALITEVELKDGKVNAKIKIIDTVSGERISTCLKHDMARLRTQLSMDSKVVGVYAENIARIPFPK